MLNNKRKATQLCGFFVKYNVKYVLHIGKNVLHLFH